MTRTRRLRTLAAGSLCLAAMVTGGCASNETPRVNAVPSSVEVTSPTQTPDPISVFGPAPESANEVSHYATLKEAVTAEGNVAVRGTVASVKISRILVGDPATDRLFMVGVTLHPTRIVSGSLPEGDVTVEFVGPSSVGSGDAEAKQGADIVAAYQNAVSTLGDSLWIVMNKGGKESAYYRLASSQCLFAVDDGQVANPMYPDGGTVDAMVSEATKFATLDDLGKHLTAAAKTS